MHPIVTKRLRWSAPDPANLDGLQALVSDFEVVKWTASWPWPADRAFTAARCVPMPIEQGMVGHVFHQGELIGVMGVTNGEFGYMFKASHWGRGFASEMAGPVLARAFATYDLPSLGAGVYDGNPASQKLLIGQGFKATGRGSLHCTAQGQELEGTAYTLLRSEWLALNPLRIETNRLLLRPYRPGDAAAFHAIANHKAVARNLISLPHPLGRAQAGDWIAARAYTGLPGFCLGVFLKDGTLIGNVGMGRDPVSVMYFLDPRHWGQGYATEAMQHFLADIFARFQQPAITAGAMIDNPASARILENLGFQRCGEDQCKSLARLEESREYLYRLSRTQFEANR